MSAETSFAGSETDTGTISIPGFANDMNTAKDVSLIDLDTSNSSSEADMNNKSTLSDTTDLTASSFVLQATSRQVMRQLASIKNSRVPLHPDARQRIVLPMFFLLQLISRQYHLSLTQVARKPEMSMKI